MQPCTALSLTAVLPAATGRLCTRLPRLGPQGTRLMCACESLPMKA